MARPSTPTITPLRWRCRKCVGLTKPMPYMPEDLEAAGHRPYAPPASAVDECELCFQMPDAVEILGMTTPTAPVGGDLDGWKEILPAMAEILGYEISERTARRKLEAVGVMFAAAITMPKSTLDSVADALRRLPDRRRH